MAPDWTTSAAENVRWTARLLTGVAVVIGVLAGCTPAQVPPAETTPESFHDLIERAIRDAGEGGASHEQEALLRAARDNGEISFEQASEAARNTVQCLTDSGVEASYHDYSSLGVSIPGYVAERGSAGDSFDSLLEQCDRRESSWISRVYQAQPSSLALQTAFYERIRPQVVVCLRDAGVDIDTDAPWDELDEAMVRAAQDSGNSIRCYTLLDEG